MLDVLCSGTVEDSLGRAVKPSVVALLWSLVESSIPLQSSTGGEALSVVLAEVVSKSDLVR